MRKFNAFRRTFNPPHRESSLRSGCFRFRYHNIVSRCRIRPRQISPVPVGAAPAEDCRRANSEQRASAAGRLRPARLLREPRFFEDSAGCGPVRCADSRCFLSKRPAPLVPPVHSPRHRVSPQHRAKSRPRRDGYFFTKGDRSLRIFIIFVMITPQTEEKNSSKHKIQTLWYRTKIWDS